MTSTNTSRKPASTTHSRPANATAYPNGPGRIARHAATAPVLPPGHGAWPG
jgi:hypothetical protein